MVSRNRAWADQVFDQVIIAASSFHSNLLANAPTVDTLTAVRIVGDLRVFQNSTVTMSDSAMVIDVGIGVTSTEAFAAGAASLPSPVVSTEYPPRGWLYVARKTYTVVVQAEGINILWPEFSFDLRSMRKIDKGVLFMSVHNSNSDGAANNVILRGRVRVLLL